MKWILFLLLLPTVVASPSSMTIVDVVYVDGEMSVEGVEYKKGYMPDPRTYPDEGWNVSLMDANEPLYSRYFLPPIEEFADVRALEHAGRIRYQEVNFSLLLPKLQEQDSIVIAADGKRITHQLEGGELLSAERGAWGLGFLIVIIIGAAIYLAVRKRQ